MGWDDSLRDPYTRVGLLSLFHRVRAQRDDTGIQTPDARRAWKVCQSFPPDPNARRGHPRSVSADSQTLALLSALKK